MALREIIDALDTFIESAGGLGIGCIKGYPDFQGGNIQPPVAALFYGGSGAVGGEAVRRRVGASTTAIVVTLGVYASNEVNLFSLAEKLQAIRKGRPVLTASTGERIRVLAGDDERLPPDPDATKEERHVLTCPVVLSFEELL